MASKAKEYQVREGRLVTPQSVLRENLGNTYKAWVFGRMRRTNRGTGRYAIRNEFARQAVQKKGGRE